ncbi:hypothetical protein HN858_03190 [Candidatus Falkowbacteria bacterium]|jgi:hypothetical protein|nr:hypothetical protein [Candidatus Falkowbacteria bacterium]MBT5503105.1 hypothetical protein [Candidatus Falkowbacteria bacterium]MBT6574199.1 hypothetical protein [Candidatus Falkowbacteria bacterium]MBT7348654.1 hypothetical protein [Candidatus Falkowbacteria bacterium]MBT7500444.1 hypothetical protein [Candidatus Falkowbacteria bacterium]
MEFLIGGAICFFMGFVLGTLVDRSQTDTNQSFSHVRNKIDDPMEFY